MHPATPAGELVGRDSEMTLLTGAVYLAGHRLSSSQKAFLMWGMPAMIAWCSASSMLVPALRAVRIASRSTAWA
jgi:hypothetical protein